MRIRSLALLVVVAAACGSKKEDAPPAKPPASSASSSVARAAAPVSSAAAAPASSATSSTAAATGPLPPTDGKPVPVAELLAGVAGPKDKWVGQKIKVIGLYVSTSTSSATSSDGKKVESTAVSLAAVKGDLKQTTSCELAAGAAPPDAKIMQWTPLLVEGKVNDLFGGSLEDCKIVK